VSRLGKGVKEGLESYHLHGFLKGGTADRGRGRVKIVRLEETCWWGGAILKRAFWIRKEGHAKLRKGSPQTGRTQRWKNSPPREGRKQIRQFLKKREAYAGRKDLSLLPSIKSLS